MLTSQSSIHWQVSRSAIAPDAEGNVIVSGFSQGYQLLGGTQNYSTVAYSDLGLRCDEPL